MVQEETTSDEATKTSSTMQKAVKASKYDAVQESEPSV